MDYPAQILAISDVPISSFLLLIVLIVVSSFFSMSETVFSSINPIRIRTYIEEQRKGSKKAFWIHERFELTLSTILVGNNLANIALATISVGVFSRIFVDQETLVTILNTVIMTSIILIFGEIIPKSFAKMHAETIALKISGVMFYVIKILKPITMFFIFIKRRFLKDDNRVTITVTEDELETIIDTMEEEGSIDEDDAERLQNVLDLSQKKVYEIMTPRVDMIACEVKDTSDKIRDVFFEHQFSRLPIYENYRDNVIGVLTERDFFTALIKQQDIDIRSMIKTPVFVSKAMRVDTLIETLQRENSHLAIVSDEFGGTSGIVTMEDALEELVGEIYDEHDDIEEEMIRQIDENTFEVNADIDMDDLFEELEFGYPPNEDQSLGSWLYDHFEELPEVDMKHTIRQAIHSYEHDEDSIEIEITFSIREIKDRRIKRVQIVRKDITGYETDEPESEA